jgi:hypothetical protein
LAAAPSRATDHNPANQNFLHAPGSHPPPHQAAPQNEALRVEIPTTSPHPALPRAHVPHL